MAISAGTSHSLALRADGTVVAWGWNDYGQTSVPAGLNNVVAVAGGNKHSLALRADGTVIGWGDNTYGQTSVPAGLSNVVGVTAWNDLALKADGTVTWWGTALRSDWDAPVVLSNVVAIAGGSFHNLALLGNGPPVLKAIAANPSLNGSDFSLQIATRRGRVYALEYARKVTDTNWLALPLVLGNGGTQTTLTDSTAAGVSRFYRVRAW